jgi:integrase
MQRGQIYRKGRSWLLGFNVKEQRDGKIKWVRRVKKLAEVSDKYRTVASVRKLAEEILSPVNADRITVEGTSTVRAFVEKVYLPFVKANLRPATHAAYERCFNLIQPHLDDIELREFDVPAADRVLTAVAKKQMAHTTHRNVRNFLSGAFRYALRKGAIRHGNPVRDAVVPKGKPPGKRHAYNLEEIGAILKVLPEPAKTAVLLAALTGLRHAEIRGLKWDDLAGDEITVRRSVWTTYIGETKTLSSKAPVPVLPVLKKALEDHRKTSTSEFIFAGNTGKPLVLANLVRRDVQPALKKAELRWYGWHAFRRGLGTNLYALGVSDKTIQAILRHSNVSTTLSLYVKTVSTESHDAMKKLGDALGN